MKKKILLMAIYFCITILYGFSQSPELFNYQAVLRNSSGEILANQSVEVQISIINNNAGGDALYTETHNETTNAYGLVNLVIGTGSATDDFSAIDWAADKRFIGVKVDAGDGLTDMGAFQLLSVPYALYANSASNLGDANIYIPQSDTLFAVKDHAGNVVFAVFPDGVKVIVEDATKGTVGGFAVSGRSPTKSETDIFRVTPDSTRIYVNDTVQSKGTVGGFAVSGRSPTKGINENYLVVTQDSTRIYVSDTISSKGSVGGFAVSGRSPTKSTVSTFLDLTSNNYFIGHQTGSNVTTGLYNIMIGYESGLSNQSGSYNTFLGYQSGYLNNASYNSFLGYLAGRENTIGAYNTFMGYESGRSNDEGDYNVFLGHQTGYSNTSGHENVFIGYRSGHSNTGGYDNIFIGNLAGENASGNTHSTFIGNEAGKNLTGDDNICIGDRSGTNDFAITHETFGTVILGIDAGRNVVGQNNTVLGYGASSSWGGESGGNNNTFVGAGAGTGGYLSRLGSDNVCLGNNAGYGKTGDDQLYIANNSTTTLIYGSFASGSEMVQINGDFHVTGNITYDGTHPVADFVFSKNYKLETIEEHAKFMWKEKHLPAVKSAADIEAEGKIDMNERREQLLEELEKAHIYIEQLNNEVKGIKEENREMKQKLDKLIELMEKK